MEKSQSLLEEEEFLERPRDMINPLKSPHDSLHPDKNAILHELLPSSDKVHFFSEKLFGNEMTLLCMLISQKFLKVTLVCYFQIVEALALCCS